MINWTNEIETLKRYVFEDKLSHEEIGRLYGCSGNNIKKVLKRREIDLPIRSKNAGKTPHNKGKCKKRGCLNCGKILPKSAKKYCSQTCQWEYTYKEWVRKYKEDNSIGKSGK